MLVGLCYQKLHVVLWLCCWFHVLVAYVDGSRVCAYWNFGAYVVLLFVQPSLFFGLLVIAIFNRSIYIFCRESLMPCIMDGLNPSAIGSILH